MAEIGLLPAGEALAEVERLLDRVDPARGGLDAAVRLRWVRLARRVRGRVDALASVLVAEADRVNASEREAGTPMAAWLGMGETLSRREAAGALHHARAIAGRPALADAATAGQVSTDQVRSIAKVLDGIDPGLDDAQQAQAEEFMMTLAGRLDADQLSKAAGQVLAEVAPAAADELLETRLQRDAEATHRNRSLRIFRDRASVRFEGSLPRCEGESWIALLDAHGERLRRDAVAERDPLAEVTTPEQRRADAFIALIRAAAATRPEPGVGSPHIMVTLDYDRLVASAAGAGLIGDGEQLSAGDLRRLCCDARIIPAVLDAPSGVLDVGRTRRLVAPAIRDALVLRDGGCTFPGCDIRPNLCDAHHIKPWWDGGETSLANLVLLCHVHHGLVEPAKYGTRDQWEVRIAIDGLPEFLPPTRLDPGRRPLRNQRRHHTRAA